MHLKSYFPTQLHIFFKSRVCLDLIFFQNCFCGVSKKTIFFCRFSKKYFLLFYSLNTKVRTVAVSFSKNIYSKFFILKFFFPKMYFQTILFYSNFLFSKNFFSKKRFSKKFFLQYCSKYFLVQQ